MPSARTLNAGKAVIKLSFLTGGIDKELRRIQSRMRDFGQSLKSIGTSGLKLSGALGGLLAIPVRLAANVEMVRAEFTALIGDATTANKVISELEGFALVTPLAVSDLSDATRTLLNFGVSVEDVVPTIKRLGEISGGNSERMSRLAYAFGQVTQAGRLMGTEVRQFVEAGFSPLKEINRTTGESMESLRSRLEAGQIGVEEVANAFKTATSEGGLFNGLLAKMAGTTIGKFNELKESITLAIRPIGDALLPMLNDLMEDVRKLVPAIADWIKHNGDTIRTTAKLTAALGLLSIAIVAIGTVMKNLATIIGGVRIALTFLYANPIIAGLALLVAGIIELRREIADTKPEVEALGGVLVGITKHKKIDLRGRFTKPKDFVPHLAMPDMTAPTDRKLNPGSPEFTSSLLGGIRSVFNRGATEVRAAAMRAQFEALPIQAMVEQAKLAFEKGRELAEEAQRLDDEIARERINGMQDGLAKEKALIQLEKQIRMRELQEAGQLTPEMRKKLDALFGAQMANAGLDLGGRVQEQQAIFDTRFASQIFGGKNDELEQLRMIARNTDPRNQRNNGGGLAVV